ncbi:MAG: chromosome segregation protein SMC, partial [Planctomycetota bacterium]|nr:chromosome segregation protein SMC [Planctomycetota bacterium]
MIHPPMLKALEIVGFKSFADKTLFKFSAGITVVVGPNGSGKSNIVDAIKWVLGEQSVKSLRGKEMADVIFNGSSSRRATNSAEITVTFDNKNHLLPIDTPQVHITRRVYRSGEGEYLINRQPSRLKDIRSLLSGTGMGTQAYSVIEQGKVDALLQSSPRDRRLIFEEAAGISLFKTKKLEALRRLERVDQNLLRLADIVDEVESRLRGVRMQAGKARRYKEYTDRLQELRTQVGLADWQRLTEQIDEYEAELTRLTDERDGGLAEIEVLDANLLQLDTSVAQINESIRASEAKISANRERIAGNETTLAHERRRAADLEQEIARHRQRLVQMNARAGDLKQQLAETAETVEAAQEHRGRIAKSLVEDERQLTELFERLDRVRAEHKQRESEHLAQMRAVAEQGNRISASESRSAAALDSREKSRQRMAELTEQLARLSGELDLLRQEAQQLAEETGRRKADVAAAREKHDECLREKTISQEKLDELRQRRGAVRQRVTVLEELEHRLEGLSAGVKQVVALSRGQQANGKPTQREAPPETTPSPGPAPARFPEVCGLVADLLQVSVESASLVEAALGDSAQRVVVPAGTDMVDYLKQNACRFEGRVGFVWLDDSDSHKIFSFEKAVLEKAGFETDGPANIDLEGRPGVLGRADRFVEVEPRFADLTKRLLGRTWFVEKLADAVELAETADCGYRFVTVAGELLDADGSITVGAQQASAGLISRRSELRALKQQGTEMDRQCGRAKAAAQTLDERAAACGRRVEEAQGKHRRAVEAAGEQRHKLTAAEERRSQIDGQRRVRQSEFAAAESQHAEAVQTLDAAKAQQQEATVLLAEMETQLQKLAARSEEIESQRQVRSREATDTKVELAKSEERLRNLQTRMRQFEDTRQERQRGLKENQEQMARCRRLFAQAQRNSLRAESQIALLYLGKEKLAAETVSLIEHRDEVGSQRGEFLSRTQRIRSKIRKAEEKIHAEDLAMGEVRHRRDSLADRLREDYGIELAELELEPDEEEQRHREEVQAEIDDLRRKINNLGNVNLEALAELNDLDTRYQTLATQHKDLADAKSELLRIIEKINSDSRRLFAETLETVRGHFQTLFRDLFGGGQADIILEDEEDILESGIEIVARPPGKEPRSISLLSGGEKTMTCVALLLAIFRSRPSPFCVLDEVDAALDEANIDRFTKVLHGFLASTQFIIVTHSKKTMTVASTIYGVTCRSQASPNRSRSASKTSARTATSTRAHSCAM